MQLTYNQSLIFKNKSRFTISCLGRRSGKSTTAMCRMDRKARVNDDGTPAFNKNIWYVGPTYGAVKNILWTSLKMFYHPSLIKRTYESELKIVLKNNSQITLKGASNPDSLRGSMLGLDHVVLDEFAFFENQDYVWTMLRPALSDKNASLDVYSTPNGYDMFYDFYQNGVSNNPQYTDWTSFHCSSVDAGILSKEEIQKARDEMGFLQFAQEYEAQFNSSFSQIYYAFSDDNINYDNSFELDSRDETIIGLDFNVAKMCAVICKKDITKRELHVVDEVVLYNSNTFEMMDHLLKILPEKVRQRTVIVPDASGRNTKSSSLTTDFDIIKSKGFRFHDMRHNPRVEDSINEVNGLLYNANKTRRLYVNSKCKELITTFRKHEYSANGGPDKTKGYDHIGDALRYATHYAYPMVNKNFNFGELKL